MSSGVTLTAASFGSLTDSAGRSVEVKKFTWQTKAGLKLAILSLDAAIVELWVPDRDRQSANILLGPDTLEEYQQLDSDLICGACFEHEGTESGETKKRPFADRVWQPFVDGTRLHLSVLLRCGRKNTVATVSVSVDPANVVHFHYQTCSTGKVVRLAHRLLVNLAGRDAGPAGTYAHVVQLNANSYVDGRHNLRDAADDVADLRVAQHLGFSIHRANGATKNLAGVYSLQTGSSAGSSFTRAGQTFGLRMIHGGTGRVVELYCDFPWLRFNTLNHLPDTEDSISSYYPRHGLRQLSLLFDLNRFIMSIVNVIEGAPEVLIQHNKHDNNKEKFNPDGRFVKHCGFLVHPLGNIVMIGAGGGTRTAEADPKSRPTYFNAHVSLKFGLCREMRSRSAVRKSVKSMKKGCV
ncbi:uncharacterized protein LOC128271119 [Anopheles cruzii]|uniref:uncharacterized protein LOC128271119 n=1 Tax=Anopheles cruzii TaxID=68878 RepID=UPI0022EC826E|nr:uncharacterized protein LOC128271119 [Anopheles cruzii]